jgi:hypothetical protein
MKEQFHIVLITAGLFVAGLLMGIWTQKTKPIPPPPAPVLGEFGAFQQPMVATDENGPAVGGFAIGRFSPGHSAAIVTMNRDIAEMEPKIREFQSAMDAIEEEFRGKLDELLTPEQQKKLAAIEAQEAPVSSGFGGPLPPPPEAEIERQSPLPGAEASQRVVVGVHTPFPIGGWLMMSMIVYQPSLDHLTSELKLDSNQQASVKELMVERRTELLALIDKKPPPTLGFGDELP